MAFLLLVLAASPALAFSPAPEGAPKGRYLLDDQHTSVTMRIKHMGFSRYTMRFDKIAGTLEYDPADRAHPKLTVEIDARSVSTGRRAFDRQIAGPDFFDADRFPKITFVGRELVDQGEGRGALTGDLTFHGVTRPLTLSVTFNGWGDDVLGRTTLGFSATGELSRSQFGVTTYKNMVADTVDLAIEAEFLKDGLLTRLLP